MGFAIRKPVTAFSHQPVNKQSKRVKDADYLEWIRKLPCVVSKRWPVEAAHISFAEPKYGKLGRGKGAKESDHWALPLHPDEHRRQHDVGERNYWRDVGIDPCVIAMALWAAFPSEERALLIIKHAKSAKEIGNDD